MCIYDETEKTLYKQLLVLFLGLMDVVHIFTKLLLPVVKHLRMCGWEGKFYIDDLGTLGRLYYECLYWKLFARDVLGRAGWVINTVKDQEPVQVDILLGSMVDTLDLKFRIPLAKMEEIKELILEALAKMKNHIKAITKIVGKLISFA